MSQALVPSEAQETLALAQDPEHVLDQASRAARALVRAVSQNESQYVVKLGPGKHLRFEAWQTLAAFFSLSVACEWVREIRDAEGTPVGWEARAVVYRGDRMITAAEAHCATDEPNWKSKPSFQLRSMAQTRAAAKALRQALAWVVVLAGYQPTPAEEVEGAEVPQQSAPANQKEEATDAQRRAIWAAWRERARQAGVSEDHLRTLIRVRYRVDSTRDLSKAQASELLDWLKSTSVEQIAEAVSEAVGTVLDAEEVVRP